VETQESFQKAYALALARISRRECSKQGLADYLRDKNTDEEFIERIIGDFVERSYVDDSRYARLLVRHQFMRGKGAAYIRQNLRTKGISLSLEEIRAFIAETSNEDEVTVASRVLLRKYPDAATDRAAKAKALRALAGKGFTFDIARKAFEKAFGSGR
jgi:SOS response regulatory protein OraA/RecX